MAISPDGGNRMQLKIREMQAAFKKLSMIRKQSRHHEHAYLLVNGKQVVRTRVSHGKGDIPLPVIRQICHQFHLNDKQFNELKSCSMDLKEYLQILREKEFF